MVNILICNLTFIVLMSQENVWLDKLDKCLKKSVKTIATDAEEISEELDVSNTV